MDFYFRSNAFDVCSVYRSSSSSLHGRAAPVRSQGAGADNTARGAGTSLRLGSGTGSHESEKESVEGSGFHWQE